MITGQIGVRSAELSSEEGEGSLLRIPTRRQEPVPGNCLHPVQLEHIVRSGGSPLSHGWTLLMDGLLPSNSCS